MNPAPLALVPEEMRMKVCLIDGTSTERVIVDTKVQPKAVEHPTDARL